MPAKRRPKTLVYKAVAIVVTVVVGVAIYAQLALVGPMKARVIDKLKDPSSAQLRNVRYFGDWTQRGGVLCGEVNAKNEMGGYVGFRPFHVYGDSAEIESEVMQELYESGKLKFCDFGDVAKWWHLRW